MQLIGSTEFTGLPNAPSPVKIEAWEVLPRGVTHGRTFWTDIVGIYLYGLGFEPRAPGAPTLLVI